LAGGWQTHAPGQGLESNPSFKVRLLAEKKRKEKKKFAGSEPTPYIN